MIERGIRWNGFEYVNWRKEKRRKRKLALLNGKIRRSNVRTISGKEMRDRLLARLAQ